MRTCFDNDKDAIAINDEIDLLRNFIKNKTIEYPDLTQQDIINSYFIEYIVILQDRINRAEEEIADLEFERDKLKKGAT